MSLPTPGTQPAGVAFRGPTAAPSQFTDSAPSQTKWKTEVGNLALDSEGFGLAPAMGGIAGPVVQPVVFETLFDPGTQLGQVSEQGFVRHLRLNLLPIGTQRQQALMLGGKLVQN